MKYLSIKNWEKFQHYKNRTPPWIKLHRDLLRDYDFCCLQDASKLHLVLLWLLASQLDNKIPNDPPWIQKQLGLKSKVNIKDLINQGFIYEASEVLAECKHLAIVETEAYKEETETEKRKGKISGSKTFPPTQEEVSSYCKERENSIDAGSFIDHYTSNGWMVGKAKMKDWKAAVRTWERKRSEGSKKQSNTGIFEGVL